MKLLSKTHHRVYRSDSRPDRLYKVGLFNNWSPEAEAFLLNSFNEIPEGIEPALVTEGGDLEMPYLGEMPEKSTFDYRKATELINSVHSKDLVEVLREGRSILSFDRTSFTEDLETRIKRRIREDSSEYPYFLDLTSRLEGVCEVLDNSEKAFLHGDIHEGNWVEDKATGTYYLIDWETYQLGPRELDYATWFFFKEFYGGSFDEYLLRSTLEELSAPPLDEEILEASIAFKIVGSLSFIHKRKHEEYSASKEIVENYLSRHGL